MSRISGGSYQPTKQTREPVDEATPGHPIGGEPTVFGIPTPTAIIPGGQHVRDLPAHHEREPPPKLTIGNPTIGPTPATTTTTTTTMMTPEQVGRKSQMQRKMSQHWLHGRLARSDEKAPKPQRERTPSPMGGSTQLTAEPKEVESVRPKPIQPNAEKQENEKREKMARALSVHRLAHPLAQDRGDTRAARAHAPAHGEFGSCRACEQAQFGPARGMAKGLAS